MVVHRLSYSGAKPSHCVQPAGNKRYRCLIQRLARLIKNETRNTRTITSAYAAC
jgi:hypothetical protein